MFIRVIRGKRLFASRRRYIERVGRGAGGGAGAEGLCEGAQGRVIAVVQPHRFTRLRDLMDDFQQAFNDADIVYAAPVYAAGEQPIDGVDSGELVAGIKRRGHHSAQTVAGADDLADKLAQQVEANDMIICLGAGDITKWAAGLADAIRAKRGVPA